MVYASDNFGGMGFMGTRLENIAKPTVNMAEPCVRGQQIAPLCILRNFRESNPTNCLLHSPVLPACGPLVFADRFSGVPPDRRPHWHLVCEIL